jgi:8-oxo-dGTP diphosphatase
MKENALPPATFTLRVYGILIWVPASGRPHVLVADEIIKGRRITKFPGGGLEYGEGTRECLVREIEEELGMEAFDLEHFYTTDVFQQSIFHDRPMQVISVYYTFKVAEASSLAVLDSPFAYADPAMKEGFRWLDLSTASSEHLDLPIDRIVLGMLMERISSTPGTSS